MCRVSRLTNEKLLSIKTAHLRILRNWMSWTKPRRQSDDVTASVKFDMCRNQNLITIPYIILFRSRKESYLRSLTFFASTFQHTSCSTWMKSCNHCENFSVITYREGNLEIANGSVEWKVWSSSTSLIFLGEELKNLKSRLREEGEDVIAEKVGTYQGASHVDG